MELDLLARFRAETEATSTAVPCVVTAVDLSGEPKVTVRPQVKKGYDTFDGEVLLEEELEIAEVPYVYPSSASFAIFVPPAVGMQGFLIVSDTEVGEVDAGVATVGRRKDPTSGYFVPSGNLTGEAFRGNADWAEMRSDSCRVALSADTVHLEAGSTSITLKPGQFDIVVNGVSLITALKQMSTHIRALEQFVHPNGMVHTLAQQRMIDNMTAATPPQRNEQGVR